MSGSKELKVSGRHRPSRRAVMGGADRLRKNWGPMRGSSARNVQVMTSYCIFETAAGFCAIAWSEKGVVRFQLPSKSFELA